MNPLTHFRKTRILSPLILLTLVAIASPTVARADAVTDWNLIASTAIVTNAGQPPHVSVLSFAMVQGAVYDAVNAIRSEEHTSELQSRENLVCRLLLEKKKKK